MPGECSVTTSTARSSRKDVLAALGAFQSSSTADSLGQLATNLVAYAGLVGLMYVSLSVSIWLTLALAVPAAGFVVRLFIIQHDCGHGSFFRARWANEAVGWLCSVITFTPFANWRRQHAGHHAVWNNLDQRHAGADMYSSCLTVLEYQALTKPRQLLYRVLRHPLVAQLLLPPLVFLVIYRVPFDTPPAWRKERRSVHLTNLALAVFLGVMTLPLGVVPVLLVQLPIMVLASIAGVWLFSVQHRFEDSQWAREENWTALDASLHGCSLLRLPRVLQWFTGNIGFHHVHHLSPRIPNYRLEACHVACPALSNVTTLTLRQAFRAPSFALWDEAAGRMVPFPSRGSMLAREGR